MEQLTRRDAVQMVVAGALLTGAATAAAAGDDRIIISGASGQLGDAAVKDLLARGVCLNDDSVAVATACGDWSVLEGGMKAVLGQTLCG